MLAIAQNIDRRLTEKHEREKGESPQFADVQTEQPLADDDDRRKKQQSCEGERGRGSGGRAKAPSVGP